MSSCAGWKREAAALLLIGIGEWRVTLPINDDDPQREDREREERESGTWQAKDFGEQEKKKKIATSIIDYATHYATSYQANWFSTPLD